MWWRALRVVVLVVACAAGCNGTEDSVGCVPGASQSCACATGKQGARVCTADGAFAKCVCEASPPVDQGGQESSGDNGSSGAMAFGGERGGTQANTGGAPEPRGSGGEGGSEPANVPATGGSSGAPTAEGGAPPTAGGASPGETGQAGGASGAGGNDACPIKDEEWCDGVDNDCNGVIDDGHICPDSTVAHTDSFSGGVYLLTSTSSEGPAPAIYRFWPTPAATYYSGFESDADAFVFRAIDNGLYYTSSSKGLLKDLAGDPPDEVVPTPPCNEGADAWFARNPNFGFDASNTVYYQCRDTLLRGNGSVVAEGIDRLTAVLADGRSIVTARSLVGRGNDFVVFDADGVELTRLNPRAEYLGSLLADPNSTTVSGNKAYVTFQRFRDLGPNEIMAYRLTENNDWELMRRVPMPYLETWKILVSDGTLFVRTVDPIPYRTVITAYPPNGMSTVVWRAADQAVVGDGGFQLLVGPP